MNRQSTNATKFTDFVHVLSLCSTLCVIAFAGCAAQRLDRASGEPAEREGGEGR
jgi:hypothetical protein